MGFPWADRPGFGCASLEQRGAGSQHTTGAENVGIGGRLGRHQWTSVTPATWGRVFWDTELRWFSANQL